MLTHTITVRLHHTDAAGVLYFANVFSIAHEAYEAVLARFIPIAQIVSQTPWLLPIVHADADYHRPIRLGEELSVQLELENRKATSFTTLYHIRAGDGVVSAQARLTHVAVDRSLKQATPLPPELQPLLQAITPQRPNPPREP